MSVLLHAVQRDRNLYRYPFLFFLFLFSFSTASVHAFFTRVLFIKIHQDPLIFISSRTRNTTSYLVNLHYRTCALLFNVRGNKIFWSNFDGRDASCSAKINENRRKISRVKYRCKTRLFMQNVKSIRDNTRARRWYCV